jgi:elongation factor Ts
MSTATLDNIKELRAKTDAPYKDCVEALKESDNDLDKASQWLKAKGKNENRTAATNCGTIGYDFNKADEKLLLVVVKTETDFVAINPDFIEAADILAQDLNRDDKDALVNFKERTWTFKEATEVCSPIQFLCGSYEYLAVYVHHNRSRASVVKYKVIAQNEEPLDTPEAGQAAYKVAMQVCSMKATHVGRENVDKEQIETLYNQSKEAAIASGKPLNIAEKIADGKVNNSLKDYVLLEQPMFDDAKMTVGQFTTNSKIQILSFTNVVV